MAMVMLCLFLVSSTFIPNFLNRADPQGDDRDALIAFKETVTVDYKNCTQSWDSSLVSASTWFNVECDNAGRVTDIFLGGCNLIGSLVPELGKLSSLKTMEMYTNALQGNIPPEIGRLTNLKTLRLNDNFLDGSIPGELSKLKSLMFLELQDNNLNGEVPGELASKFPSMNRVNLTNNKGLEGQKGLSGNCTEKACCGPDECPA